MIFADKLIRLRKKAGWSQEELAARLDVSRQSVSKWESAQSIPDLEKIVRLSKLFGVTTDYLLKDEMTDEEMPKESSKESEVRYVSNAGGKPFYGNQGADIKDDRLRCFPLHYFAVMSVAFGCVF